MSGSTPFGRLGKERGRMGGGPRWKAMAESL